jgi:hypothetical protein
MSTNDSIHGFELLREERIAEINSLARIYKHVKTGAQFVSVINDDENKSFGIAFATPWNDSTGIAHIMEHSVLCGSRKYPLKEPFIELAKGSLNTFLNAMTYPDKTVYPVASQNTQDLYNLVDVYLDSVFYPSITENTLKQEGWHYDQESKDAPMIFKGVVFNEMKGNYSSPDSMIGRASQWVLFPDNAYGVDSGGDPKVIPSLTYATFKKFHETYYHPSNAMIWWYGDDDPDKRLAYLDSWLREFDAKPIDARVKLQPRFTEPRSKILYYDVATGEESAKSQISVNWMIGESGDVENDMAWQILSYILLSTQASPLRKALIDSGLGEDVTGGFEDELRQTTFGVGMKGVAGEKLDQVEQVILNTLSKLADDGIEAEMIEAAMNTIEFRMREMNTGRFPRGLALWLSSLSTWLHGGDPLQPLRYEAPLNAIKTKLKNGQKLFENLIGRDLLNNPHRVKVTLLPDPSLREREDAAERAKLDAAAASMSQSELDAVLEDTHKLREMQETPDSAEALAKMPTLTLADIDKQNRTIPIEVTRQGQTQIVYHDLFTNGIAYVDVGFNLRALPSAALPYLGLFRRLLLSMGTEAESYVKLSQRIGRKTGGLYASTLNSTTAGSVTNAAYMFLRGKGTMSQLDDLLDIMRDVLLTAKLDDKDRIKQIVLEEKARNEGGLIPGGHGVVNTRLKGRFTAADFADEQMGGISYLFFLRDLAEQIETDWPSVLNKLAFVRRYLVNRNGMVANITLDEKNWRALQPKLSAFIGSLPAAPAGLVDWNSHVQKPRENEGLTMPSQVNYVGKGANLFDLGYPLHGSINVISNWLRTSYLWERVRVQGGAYGGFCTFDARSGVWTYLSYRDPNLLKTLDNYDGTGPYLRANAPSQSEVERAIIGVIGSLDAYELPDAKGFTSLTRYLLSIDDGYRQHIRDEVLGTTTQDFVNFADVLDAVRDRGQIVVLGSAAAMDAANAERGKLLSKTKVM